MRFEDDGTVGATPAEPIDGEVGRVRVTTLPNGPLVFEGTLSVTGLGQQVTRASKGALCRCGASKNKPFCDGSHVGIGFTAE